MVNQQIQVLIVPGLRDHSESHWQTLLAQQWPGAQSLAPLGRDNLSLTQRLEDLESALTSSPEPWVLVAHSGGCVLVAHWASRSPSTHRVRAALLATPPTFDRPLPPAYPSLEALDTAGWLPVPRLCLPFRSLVAASRNDPLGDYRAVCDLAQDWGSAVEDLGEVGHLNPASGFGAWPQAVDLINRLCE